MVVAKRRALLGAALAGLGVSLLPGVAQATLIRGMTLAELSQSSDRILVGSALSFDTHWETVAGRRRIVTDTRVRVDEVLAKQDPADSEILVRTLGGTVGDISALVHGEAMLGLQEPCVLFLSAKSQLHRVRGMSQGHYPVVADARRIRRLAASPRAAELTGRGEWASQRLVGQDVARARVLIREALSQ